MDGTTVKLLRLKYSLTQAELAALAGYTRALISKVENGHTANHRTMARLSEVFRMKTFVRGKKPA